MALLALASPRGFQSVVASHALLQRQIAWYKRTHYPSSRRQLASQATLEKTSSSGSSEATSQLHTSSSSSSDSNSASTTPSSTPRTSTDASSQSVASDWEDASSTFDDFTHLPKDFGKNQHIETNEEFKRSLRSILRKFPPISYAFAYGSGVFPQSSGTTSRVSMSPHPNPPEAILKWQKGGGKMIDFILATKFTDHFHSLNLNQHPDHYSFLGRFGSGLISHINDNYGAGAYFNPYITVNGTLIKYGVVNFDRLHRDLSDWETLYFAGRLHKPVKLLFEEPNLRVANQRNLLAALRCSLLLLPSHFSEKQLFETIAGLSYRGDPRMQYGSENPKKIENIVEHQIKNFRLLYHDLLVSLPNVQYLDPQCATKSDWMDDASLNVRLTQDLDPKRRANIVRRLPKAFRQKLYFLYQRKFEIPNPEFQELLEASADEDASGGLKKQVASRFDVRIAGEEDLGEMVGKAVGMTVKWPSTVESLKGGLSAGPQRAWRYWKEKREKSRGKV